MDSISQFMASANKLIKKFLIPIVLGIYFLFLVYDYQLFNNNKLTLIVETHSRNLEKNDFVDGLIIGGSNAAFGISAEFMSHESKNNWYNLSLMHEGFSDINYHEFIKESFKSKRFRIKRIIYSPISQFRVGAIEERQNYIGPIGGTYNFDFKPNMSILSHLKLYLDGNYANLEKGFPLPNEFGDFNFDEYSCQGSPSKSPFENEDISLAASYIASNIETYLLYFPNSQIFLSHPPEFYGETYDEELIDLFIKDLNKNIYKKLKDSKHRIHILNQKPITDIKLMCDGKHHTNSEGRKKRSKYLLENLK